MKVIKCCIGYALVASAIVLALDVIGILLLLFMLATPATVLGWDIGKELSRILAQWCVAIGSVVLVPGVIGWIIFFANRDSLGTNKNRKDVK